MNMKELEQLYLKDRAEITATLNELRLLDEAKGNQIAELRGLVTAQANEIEARKHQLAVMNGHLMQLDGLINTHFAGLNALRDGFKTHDHWIAELRTITHQMREDTDMMGLDIDDFGFDFATHVSQEFAGIVAKVEVLEEKIGARNKSAAVKRNMTDDDARRVLTGDQKDVNHKDAGSNIGLTYAQVYSCRLEFTFKHVHKELRDKGWKNPWKQ